MQVFQRIAKPFRVALRKESVDRNINCDSNFTQKKQSLSARRAWIEMGVHYDNYNLHCVALRKESVDRNYRCWCARYSRYVALRKESVDRNSSILH